MKIPEEFKNNSVIQDLVGRKAAQEHLFRTQKIGSARDAAKKNIDSLDREIRDKVHELQQASEKIKIDKASQDAQRKLTWKQVIATGVIALITSVFVAVLTTYLTAKWSNDGLVKRIEVLENQMNQSKLEAKGRQ